MPTHISPRKNLQLFFILASWSYPKCKDILQRYIYWRWMYMKFLQKTSGRWLLSGRWNISFVNMVVKIFRICPSNITKLQKTKEDRNCQIYNFFFFKCPTLLSVSRAIILKKTKKYPLKITFLYKFLFKVQNISP